MLPPRVVTPLALLAARAFPAFLTAIVAPSRRKTPCCETASWLHGPARQAWSLWACQPNSWCALYATLGLARLIEARSVCGPFLGRHGPAPGRLCDRSADLALVFGHDLAADGVEDPVPFEPPIEALDRTHLSVHVVTAPLTRVLWGSK